MKNESKNHTYKTLADAEMAGWITIGDTRRLLSKTEYTVEDVSGHNEFGYHYAIRRPYDKKLDGEINGNNAYGKSLIGSDTIWLENTGHDACYIRHKFREMFSKQLIENLLNNKRGTK